MSSHPLGSATTLRRAGEGKLTGETSDAYWNFAGPFGGYTAALLMRAVLDDPRRLGPPVTQTVNFCAPIAKGAFEIAVELQRSGKATQHWSLELRQQGAVVATGSIVLANRRETFHHAVAAPPAVPSASDVPRLVTDGRLPWLSRYDFRFVEGSPGFGRNPREAGDLGGSRTALWLRDAPDRPLDYVALAALADCFILRLVQMRGTLAPMSTVSMTTHFHATPDELQAHGTAHLLGIADAARFNANFHDQSMQLWGAGNRLLATGMQTVWYRGVMPRMSYDLIIIGTGPGGYVCAIRAAQLGLKVAVVEKRATHGGTCANVGCIPSKALLHASELFHEAGHGFAVFGIDVSPKLDLARMMKHKADTVASNVGGVAFLLKKNKVNVHHGLGTILGAGRVQVTAADGTKSAHEAKSIVIATGSEASALPGVSIDEKKVVTSTGALELAAVPERLIVIGAGVIGLELGSVWRRLGAEVTVIEYLDRILPGMDGEVAKQLQRLLEKQGFKFHLSSKVTKVAEDKSGCGVNVEPVAGGAGQVLSADVVLVATGRRPNTDGLGLDAAGVKTERGRVVIDDHFATTVPGIYAIGDVVRGPMLAHKAEEEGVAVAEMLAGQAGHVNYDVIPGVVYTFPEVAAVGKTEEEAKAAGLAYKVGKFNFSANGRARANRTADGFVKVIADATTDRVLGVHIVGAGAGEMIHEAAVLMEFGGSAEDLARTCHAHPTMSEAVKEAALAVEKRAIHA